MKFEELFEEKNKNFDKSYFLLDIMNNKKYNKYIKIPNISNKYKNKYLYIEAPPLLHNGYSYYISNKKDDNNIIAVSDYIHDNIEDCLKELQKIL